jgi:hypothetical protein
LPSWQTETAYYIREYKDLPEWEIGRGRANEIYYELSSGASAVEGMCMFWPDAVDTRFGGSCRSEGHLIVVTTDGKNVVRWEVTKDAGAVFAHYGRFVRPGDQRVFTECDDPFIHATAFLSAKSQRAVAVIINNSKTSKKLFCQLDHLSWKPRFLGGLLTDETRTLEQHPIVAVSKADQIYEVNLPGLSLATFVWAEENPGSLALPEGIRKR